VYFHVIAPAVERAGECNAKPIAAVFGLAFVAF
jgi:hypothetical protein